MSSLKPFGNNIFIQPLKLIYLLIISCRNALYNHLPFLSKDTNFFTISIGGIHAGGTGKTPTAALIGAFFEEECKVSPLFLSRGYGRIEKNPVIVKSSESADWQKTGDEPALLKMRISKSKLAIGSNRLKALKLFNNSLEKNTPIILDDGFQHRQIKRDLNILCLPPNPFNDYLIPAGTMREPLSSINRSNIIFIIGSQDEQAIMEKSKKEIIDNFPQKKIFILHQIPEKWINLKNGEKKSFISSSKNVAISAIARPKRFLNMLDKLGVLYFKSYTYPDHHIFKNEDVEKLNLQGDEIILTTEKDAIRLSSLNLVNLPNIWYLKIILEFSDTDSRGEFCQLVTDLFNKRCKICKG